MNAIITGATKGIGKAIAIKLAKAGYNLAICARNIEELETTQQRLTQFGVAVLALQVNCADKLEVQNFCENVIEQFQKIDVLVNNVGVFIPGSLLDEEDEAFEIQLQVNLNAAYYLSKAIGKQMRTQQAGHIFNICSVASKDPVENAGGYSVTKAAMLSLNHVLRKELAPHSVKVTAILPGATLTASWEGTMISPEKFVQPEDIAEALFTTLSLSKGVNVDEIIIKPQSF